MFLLVLKAYKIASQVHKIPYTQTCKNTKTATHKLRQRNYLNHFLLFFFLGSLSILKALDREEQEVFNLTIVAEDHGIPQLSTSQVLCVQVIDVNDEAPVFQRSEFEAQVMENQGPGTTVLTVTATDRDQGTHLKF